MVVFSNSISKLKYLFNRYYEFVIIALFLGIAMPLAYYLNIWRDEVYTMNTASGDVWRAIKQSFVLENQPPFYFILMLLWNYIHISLFWGRLFSVLAILGTLFIIRQFIRENCIPRVSLALVAFNPFIVWAAVEMRAYALIIFLSSILIWYFYKVFLKQPDNKSDYFLYLLLAIVAIYTQYYLGILLLANCILLITKSKWRDLKKYMFIMIISSLSLLPILKFLPDQIVSQSKFMDTSFDLLGMLKFFMVRFEQYIFSLHSFNLSRGMRWLVRILFIITLIQLFKIKKYSYDKKVLFELISNVTIISISFFFIAYFFGVGFVLPRHTTVLFLPLMLLFCTLLFSLKNIYFRLVWIILLVIFYIGTLHQQYHNMAKTHDWRGIVKYITTHEKKDQPVLMYSNYLALPFNYYYAGMNLVVPIPKKIDFKTYDYSEFILQDTCKLNDIFNKLNNFDDFWLITDKMQKYKGIGLSPALLNSYLTNHFIIFNSINFDSKITIYKLKKI